MFQLQSYLCDQWVSGGGDASLLVNPATEEVVAQTSTRGLDFGAAVTHGRAVGGPVLRSMSFAERGALLKAMSRALHAAREELLDLATLNNGATRSDGKFDVDGATGTLAFYARLGESMGGARFLLDGDPEPLSRGARFVGQHVRLPRPGVAVHVNAFNFPAWGTFEKIAVAFLAGMPVITKPATATALLAWRMVQIVVEAGILPAGTLQLVAGSPGDLVAQLGPQDVLAFTGSAGTGAGLRAMESVRGLSVHVNVEADSLNAAVLGPDVGPSDELWSLMVRNVVTDMTQKTGQKCTAIRRVMVPADRAADFCDAITEELARVVVGDPAQDGVSMGPVATAAQLRDVRAGIDKLGGQTRLVTGGSGPVAGQGAPKGLGYYVAPTLLVAHDSANAGDVHSHEVFGPCATVLPYSGTAADAAGLIALGQGSLVSSIYSDDRGWLSEMLFSAAPWNGRLLMASAKVADQTSAPGMVLPNLLHGGPGRAGGGEELGSARGLELYMQRSAIQGDSGLLRKMLSQE